MYGRVFTENFCEKKRGNTYSKNHTTLSPDDDTFWQFSWDEMAEYDFPTQIQFAVQGNGKYSKLVYIGHSEGTTQAFAGLILNSTIAESLYGFVGLGPVISVNHMTNLWLKVRKNNAMGEIQESYIYLIVGGIGFIGIRCSMDMEFTWSQSILSYTSRTPFRVCMGMC